ncbi:MAG: hypothetical protein JSS02_08405 [Planctomycetes bacterium]|nr:hypothetical protein [Planctomycetota bacterium]
MGGRFHASDVWHQAIYPLLGVSALILVLAVAVYLIRSWMRENDGPDDSAHDLLTEYREMHSRGELTDEEYRIIKGRMASRIGGNSEPKREADPKD